ncbi:FAS-associated death domain protein isoform X2 [Muntiacus reevesi]|uniref:FAS-associated death domain protein isoform X2 n=1 Tax=Muntiacus reevesi TaxID=9886 RepID=UPI0033071D1F
MRESREFPREGPPGGILPATGYRARRAASAASRLRRAEAPAAMDPFLVLLHSVSAGLSGSDLAQLKFLCRNCVSKRKLELAQSGLDLFAVLLEQNELSAERTALLRELLCSLKRADLLRRLDDFERGAAGGAAPEERDLQAAMEIICDNVGKDWKRLARHLRVSDIKIEAIEEKYPRNLAEQESPEEDKDVEENAALKIQAAFRGHLAREEVKKMKSSDLEEEKTEEND